MFSRILSCVLQGVEARLVDVQVDLSPGLPSLSIVGLPDAAVKESRERVRSAIRNSGFSYPIKKMTVNLAPAQMRKEGSGLDLPVALGILAAEGHLPAARISQYLVIGELGLDGKVKPVRGVLSMAQAAQRASVAILLPRENAPEAAVVRGARAVAIDTLGDAIEILSGRREAAETRIDLKALFLQLPVTEDFSDVKGQEQAKRALEIAAAGGHNLLMVGPPGAGKTMLARRVPSILPPMTVAEAIETTKIHSAVGDLALASPLITTRPFRAPHHSISDAAMLGGGPQMRPGEVSLAHNGVLFLDEFPEFRRNVLEVLREPLEDGFVKISRAAGSLAYAASFMLIAAMNPCPCGYLSDPVRPCICPPAQIARYRTRISGPLLDRIDIHLEVPPVPVTDLSSDRTGEESAEIRRRVSRARAIQQERYIKEGIFSNGQLSTRLARRFSPLDPDSKRLLSVATDRLGLSARAHHRILRLARTIADLEGRERIGASDLSEAIAYRTFDRREAA